MKKLIPHLILFLLLLSTELQISSDESQRPTRSSARIASKGCTVIYTYDSDSDSTSESYNQPSKKPCLTNSSSIQYTRSETDILKLNKYKAQTYKPKAKKPSSVFSPEELRSFAEQEKLIKIKIIETLIDHGIEFDDAKNAAEKVGDKVNKHLYYHSESYQKHNDKPRKRKGSAYKHNQKLVNQDTDAFNIEINTILKNLKQSIIVQKSILSELSNEDQCDSDYSDESQYDSDGINSDGWDFCSRSTF